MYHMYQSPATLKGHFSRIEHHRISSGCAVKPFPDASAGFLAPQEMPLALDPGQRRYFFLREAEMKNSRYGWRVHLKRQTIKSQ